MTRRILIVIPAHNEAVNLAEVVTELRASQPQIDVLVVDDGSTDETVALARQLDVRWLRFPERIGIGGAMRAGLRYAARIGYDVVVRIDGDGQHRPDEIAHLLAPVLAGRADVVLGSRFGGDNGGDGGNGYTSEERSNGGLTEKTSTVRRVGLLRRPTGGGNGSRGRTTAETRTGRSSARSVTAARRCATPVEPAISVHLRCSAAPCVPVNSASSVSSDTVVRALQRTLGACLSLLTGHRVTDPTSGFWVLGPRAIHLLAEHHPTGYPEPELRLLLSRNALRVVEMPVDARPRLHGTTSLTPMRLVAATARVLLAMVVVPLRGRV